MTAYLARSLSRPEGKVGRPKATLRDRAVPVGDPGLACRARTMSPRPTEGVPDEAHKPFGPDGLDARVGR